MKHNYDKSCHPPKFNINDKVMLWYPYAKKGLSCCFQPKFNGPWTITEFKSPTNVEICNERGKRKNVHVNQLKLCVTRAKTLSVQDKTTNARTTLHHQPEMGYFLIDDDSEHNYNNPDIETDNREIIPARNDNLINHAWVDIEPSNIIPQRTHGGMG